MINFTKTENELIDRTIKNIVEHLGLEDSDSHLDMIIEDLVTDVRFSTIQDLVKRINEMEEKK